ncbi:hypothetical protein HYFRA_00003086 [Hymenoscyphus fraxineus]|uniref:Pre-mRNA-splicing factor n=1 Tax=Hymenoscyphus fraxineus TaxID=746836 RepID=A0A9N9PFU5_9HELO|nr:hypothetical protein HYFRA_00003086 [Hymenoscyphus fraxineus]
MSPSKDDPASGSSTPRIAIKGFSLSSKAASSNKPSSVSKPGASSKATFNSSLGKRPRSTFNHDSGSDSDDSRDGDSRRRGKHEVVTGFGEDGAISKADEERKRREREVLVIPKMPNRDWRADVRRVNGRNLLPPEVVREREAKARGAGEGKIEGVDCVNSQDGEIKWGLSLRKREKVEDDEVEDEEEAQRDKEEEPQQEREPQTADQEALAALLGQKPENKGPDLVIPITTTTDPVPEKISEQDAYRRAIAAAPDPSTLEDYTRVPVEEFGAALLRGMGWKGENVGKVRDVKRRQNLLGLGAKELKDAEELGAWVQKSDVKRLKTGGDKRNRREEKKGMGEYRREREDRERRREGGGRDERERERDRRDDRDRDRRGERDGGYRRRDDRERDRRR